MSGKSVIVSAPGRINLIGEHTDYSLLPVLPVATKQRLGVRAELGDAGVVVARSEQFEGVFRTDRSDNPPWAQYLGPVVELAAPAEGAHLTIDGDLPTTGGLSSSSALSVATLLALLRLSGTEPDRNELVDLAVRAERGTGVEGGAMDQTLIVHAVAGTALRIDFDPISWRQIAIPESVAFVAGYSGSPAPKGGSARDSYNARVVGTRTAARLLGNDALSQVEGGVEDALAALPAWSAPDPEAIVLSAGTFDSTDPLPVRAWARHVLTEAQRVEDAEAALEAGNLETIGRLFDASHSSLADDYGVSTAGLDRLVGIARQAGAMGARLTGAGFGGWAVAVCHPDLALPVEEAMTSVAGQAFVVEPSGGVV